MEYTILGKTGIKISRVGLGAWQFSEAWGLTDYRAAKAVVARAVELGINFFDTAMVYGMGMSEVFLGRALREIGVKRDHIVISTKIPGEFLNPIDIFRSVEKSLRNLGVDYIDVLLAHWPPCWHNFPTCEYARAMERLVLMGKVHYLGLSDYPVELVEAFRNCLSRIDIQILQVRYNLVERWAERTHVPYAEKYNMTVQAWSPIAKGALTGKYEPGKLEFQDVRSRDPIFHPGNYTQVWSVVQLLREIGEKYGKKPVQVALNWLITTSPVIVPIPGAKTPEQVEELADSVGWRLSYEDWRRLDEATRNLSISYSVVYVEKDVKVEEH
ncbi:putative aldo/keto reductase [Pyrodictium delaneyi]|uniref:Aldo/keto reductase n=1 Tax=Pyrodictium delaneyi TaxID=1273541 RepID=A0A0N7JCY0_9CREN|nr:aldo/keto reductase [Pyrodictium delaneyi]ALL00649.1 putative aldo/keto reductase [Pyrodictium delaneyi]OWJ54100.1 aldo/keto reductase [Pyrodictium delaneyi]